MWKIITTSNYDLESYAQSVVAEHIPSEAYGKIMLEALQAKVHSGDPTWYSLVSQDKPLWYGVAEFADLTCSMCGHDCYPNFPCME